MSHIDDLLTEFRGHVPPAEPAAAARVARDLPMAPPGRTRRIPRRRLALVGSTLATAAMVGVLAVLLVQSSPQPTSEPSSVPTTPRVDWGVNVTVAVAPLPGVALEVATAGAVEALRERGQQRDIAGLDVTQTAPGTLSVKVPGTQSTDEIRRLLTFAELAVYDVDTTFLDRGPNLNAIRDSVLARATGAKIQGYAVTSRSFPGTIMELQPTRAAAEKLAPGFGPDADILPVPEGIRLVSSGPFDFPGETTVVRDLPLLGSVDFESMSIEGDVVTLTLTEDSRDLLRKEFGGTTTLVQRLAVVQQFQGGGTRIGALNAESLTGAIDTGTLAFRAPDSGYAAMLAIDLPTKSIGGSLTQTSSDPYGVRPLPAGEAQTLPEAVAKDAGRAVAGSVVRAVSTESTLGQVELWVGRTLKGLDWFWTVTEPPGVGLGGNGNWCEPFAGPPRLQSCGSSGTDIAVLFAGRVERTVSRVEIVPTDGSPTVAATVQNGWYIAVKAAPDRGTRKPGQLSRAPIIGPHEVVAYDSGGGEVARIDRNGELVLPAAGP